MKKAIFNKKGTRMIIDSKHKTFNNQTNLISKGAVISNTQVSDFIRPVNHIHCLGNVFEKGSLTQRDMKKFGHIPQNIKDYLLSEERTQHCILYKFFIYNKNKRTIDTLGFILTDDKYNFIMEIVMSGRYYEKRLSAIETAKEYVCN